MRVANLPEADFERQIESDDPPTSRPSGKEIRAVFWGKTYAGTRSVYALPRKGAEAPPP